MARYTKPHWTAETPNNHYYGENGSGRSGCYAVNKDWDGLWYVVPPNDAPWPGIDFRDLPTAKAWVEIEASNHA